MRVVHIQLNGVKQVLDPGRLGNMAIDEVFVPSSNYHLTRDSDLLAVLVSDRTRLPVTVVERDRYSGLRDSSLALFVDELLEITRADLRKVRDAQHETDGVQDIRLSRSIQTSYRVEIRVEAGHYDALGVGLEAVDGDLFDVHLCLSRTCAPWRRARHTTESSASAAFLVRPTPGTSGRVLAGAN